eukprot:TRINITY_DN11576_c0_g1_i1.p1 TRINITY_DN11576_c0_g1~~TRINITY_DN11576_c0_g1_i1.p1  ORF type:complete len:130 (-),score=25.68 TRINITY_DN11576_c0_g1_i1:330-719(-)
MALMTSKRPPCLRRGGLTDTERLPRHTTSGLKLKSDGFNDKQETSLSPKRRSHRHRETLHSDTTSTASATSSGPEISRPTTPTFQETQIPKLAFSSKQETSLSPNRRSSQSKETRSSERHDDRAKSGLL